MLETPLRKFSLLNRHTMFPCLLATVPAGILHLRYLLNNFSFDPICTFWAQITVTSRLYKRQPNYKTRSSPCWGCYKLIMPYYCPNLTINI